MRAILVPLDGSYFGEQALPWAIALAERTGALIHLVHVDTPVMDAYAGGYPGRYALPPARKAERYQQERHYLETLHRRITGSTHVAATWTVLMGTVAEALVDYAEREKISLIAMTTHGRGPMARFWLGSVVDSLIRQAGMPLFVVRPHERVEQSAADVSLRHVMIPLDGSAYAEQAIAAALEVSGHTGVRYTLVRVVEPFTVFDAVTLQHTPAWQHEDTQRREGEADDYLKAVARRLQTEDVEVTTRVITAEHPAFALVDEAHEGVYDLVAMATHGHGGLRRLLVGSVADKVLRATTGPLLIVRPADTQPPREQT